jgi:hypothetical protein
VPHGESRNADSSLRLSATVRNDNSESWLPEASYGLQRYESTLLINSLYHCEKSSPLESGSIFFLRRLNQKKSHQNIFHGCRFLPPVQANDQRRTANDRLSAFPVLLLWIIRLPNVTNLSAPARHSQTDTLRAANRRPLHVFLDLFVLREFPHEKFSDCTILMELTTGLPTIRFFFAFTKILISISKLTFRKNRSIAKSGNQHFDPPSPKGWIPREENTYPLENLSHPILNSGPPTHGAGRVHGSTRAGTSRSRGRLHDRILGRQPQHHPAGNL